MTESTKTPSDTLFYYVTDEHGHPRTTVCISETSTGEIVRGVSICSLNDKLSKNMGRKLAYMRMSQAKETGKTTLPILNPQHQSVATLMDSVPLIDYKSEYDVYSTPYEDDLLVLLRPK